MIIPPRGHTFIRVAPHLLAGALTISVFSSASSAVNFSARAGHSYAFSSRPVYIAYAAGALFPCEVTVWKVRSGCEYAAYSRNFQNAQLTAFPLANRDFQVCWFLQLPAGAGLLYHVYPESEGRVELLHMAGGTSAPFELAADTNATLADSTFLVVIHPHAAFTLDITSASAAVDWADGEGFFAECRRSLECAQNTSAVGRDTLSIIKRPVAEGALLAVIVVSAIALGAVSVLLFLNASSEFSMGSGMKPLGNVLALPFT
jgi:hypothetical protein